MDARKARVQAIVESFPEAITIDINRADMQLRFRTKGFGWWLEEPDEPSGIARIRLVVKALPGVSESRILQNSERYFCPRVEGKLGWIGIWMDTETIEWADIESLLTVAYCMVSPKKFHPTETAS